MIENEPRANKKNQSSSCKREVGDEATCATTKSRRGLLCAPSIFCLLCRDLVFGTGVVSPSVMCIESVALNKHGGGTHSRNRKLFCCRISHSYLTNSAPEVAPVSCQSRRCFQATVRLRVESRTTQLFQE